jgi:23S rRNA (guanosine2251-2'-O)-methyltransferase
VCERAGSRRGDARCPVVRAPAVWLALDCLQDPHNVGAVFRTAAFFGIRGVVLTKDRSAPMSSTVYDVASGGVEQVPFVQTPNLAAALKAAKAAGVWVLGSSEHAERDVTQIPRDRPWLLVIGNEEHGLRRLSQELCDDVCRITPRGPLGSLNASVAAGVLMATLRGPEEAQG